MKQGLGKKVYSNGDVYEGLWRHGKCEGPGRYRWKNNNEYDGEWKAGRMHGRGTLKWHTGEACLHTVMHIPSHAEDLCYTLGILTLEMDAGIRCTAGQYCASC